MKLNKKGFTIVELVIVIAVIAILAAVLIPTFSSVIDNANRSAALQEAKVAMEIVAMEENADLDGKYYIIGKDYVFEYDADATGITNTKPKKNEYGKTVEESIEKLKGADLKDKTLEYYANSKDAAKALDTKTSYDGTTPVKLTVNSDISKNVIVIGLDNGKN